MKTRNSILVALIVLFMSSVSVFAGETSAQKKAKENLEANIQTQLRFVPFDDLVGTKGCCQLTLIFRIDEAGNVYDYRVYGENQDLARWVKNELEGTEMIADSELAGKVYRVKLSFLNGRAI